MIALTTLIAATTLATPAPEAPPAPPLPEVILSATLVDLQVPQGLPETFSFTVDLGGVPTTVVMARFSMRTDDFQVLFDDGSGELTPIDAPESLTYRGSVVGDPGSVVAGAIHDDGLSAMIRLSSNTTWMIEPAARLSPGSTDPRHVLYRGSDLAQTGHTCANSQFGFEPAQVGEGGLATDTPNWTEIGIDTDFEYFQKNGSNVTATVNDVELVMNNVDAVFNDDVGISYEITVVIIRSAVSDPYTATDIGDRLCEFRSVWNSAPESSIQRDIAHMFSGVSFAGGTIGIAWLGVVCNDIGNVCGNGNGNIAYCIVESKYLGASTTPLYLRISLTAHELGHNWNATHCDSEGNANCHIMCSANNACGGVFGSNLKFDALAIAQITAYKNGVTCEPVIAAPLALPFVEDFTTTAVNSTRWIHNKGAIVSSSGVGEPSPNFSLQLDSLGSNDYQDDQIRSNRMLLAGLGAVRFTYYTQHIGVELDEEFFVEYFTSAGKWSLLNTIVSDGENQTIFTKWGHQLPANAKHDKFRIRFRTNGSDGTDDWYVDNIRVELGTLCTADIDGNGTVDGIDLATLLGNWGTANAIADLDSNGIVDGIDLAIVLGAWGPC